MAITQLTYGDVNEAAAYFGNKLHETAWSNAAVTDRPKALIAATQIIDALAYKGYKYPVWQLLKSYSPIPGLDQITTNIQPQPLLGPGSSIHLPTIEMVRTAEASQPLEFPRGDDTVVPEAIRIACYEIAYSLLDGKDPEIELENLGVESYGYSSARTSFSRTQMPVEHIVNMVPSAIAFRLLRPFLRDEQAIKLSRIS
jgi:hypothetical protein